MRFIIGMVLMLASFLGAYFIEGGDPLTLVGITPFLIVFFIPLISTIAVWEIKDISAAFSNALGKGVLKGTLRKSGLVLDFLENIFYASGILGLLTGLILVLSNITVMEKLGFSIAVSLLSMIYGILFGITTHVLRARIEEKKEL